MVAQYRKAAERRSQPRRARGEGERPRPVTWQDNWDCFPRQPKTRKGPAAQQRQAELPELDDRCRSQEAPPGLDCQR